MVWKKWVATVIGLLLIGMAFGAAGVSAASTGSQKAVTVILVSDNTADSGVAKLLANATGGVIVTTPWGIYEPNVTAEILSYAPDQVIIIGGPMAVVNQYVTDLQGYNITVYRWGGINRYETNLIALEMAKGKGLLKKDNVTVFAPGNDTVAIQEAVKIAIQKGGIVVYVNKTVSINKLNKTITIRKAIVVNTPVSKGLAKGLMKQLFRHNSSAVDITVNVTGQVQFLEKLIQLRIERIEEIANMTNSTELLSLAQNLSAGLDEVNKLLQAGNTTQAYKKLLWLQVRSQFVLKRTNFVLVKEMTHGKFGIMVRLMRLKAELEILQKAGVNVAPYNQMLTQAEEYFKKGNDGMALKLLTQLEKQLRELYKQNWAILREFMRKKHKGWMHGPRWGSNQTSNKTWSGKH
ncbi:cell wall-binding repeat 2 family protein [Thermococcus sp.]|uniref:cell wall-binding repeat-containing protein n=1 Tax=Thermococcus sp. TaxID=35749 RepID=UPI0026058D7B|nr:cell wall-binding repeat 2 family protein [Thermococcus sp.]